MAAASQKSKRSHPSDSVEELLASETESDTNKPKKIKSTKKKQYEQKYLDKYSLMPGIKPSLDGPTSAYCSYCRVNFDISHSGQYDIVRHCSNETHNEYVKKAKGNQSISSMFARDVSTLQDMQVIKAETLFTDFIVDLNLPITAADRITKVVKNAFPDSKIAAKYECGRTKTTALVKCLAEDVEDDIVVKMKSGPYCLSTDGSNDQRNKQFPVVISLPNSDGHGVHQSLLSVPILKDRGTGENIFKVVYSEITKRGIPFENCLAFGTDNANVMVGTSKGVWAYLLKKNKNLHLAGCPCHLLHHAAEKAQSSFPFSMDDILVTVYYYLDKSSKRLGDLEEFQLLYDVEHKNILKHCPTRWLSISTCLDRLLENWDAFKKFFQEEVKQAKPKKVIDPNKTQQESAPQRMTKFFKSPTNRLYCLFLQYAIKPFIITNTKLQSDAPLVHKLPRIIRTLVRDLLNRFVAPWAMTGKTLDEIKFKTKINHKKDKDLMIGEIAREFISEKEKHHLRDSKIAEFYVVVKTFYENGIEYIKKKLPLHNELLQKVEVADVSLRTKSSFSQVTYLVKRFPCLLPQGCSLDELELEFSAFQTCELPDYEKTELRIDHMWIEIGKMKDEAGVLMFKNISFFMLGILTIPHSNAACERVFSVVRKNKTEQRASLGPSTMNALMVCKARPGDHTVREYPSSQLRKLKSAYYNSLKKPAAATVTTTSTTK